MKRESEASILMWEQLKESNLPWYAREFRFCRNRRWKFDFVTIGEIAIEIEGGAFTQGRHTRGTGFIKDMEKYNHAVLLGWRVLRFAPSQVLDGTAIAFIKKVLES